MYKTADVETSLGGIGVNITAPPTMPKGKNRYGSLWQILSFLFIDSHDSRKNNHLPPQ